MIEMNVDAHFGSVGRLLRSVYQLDRPDAYRRSEMGRDNQRSGNGVGSLFCLALESAIKRQRVSIHYVLKRFKKKTPDPFVSASRKRLPTRWCLLCGPSMTARFHAYLVSPMLGILEPKTIS